MDSATQIHVAFEQQHLEKYHDIFGMLKWSQPHRGMNHLETGYTVAPYFRIFSDIFPYFLIFFEHRNYMCVLPARDTIFTLLSKRGSQHIRKYYDMLGTGA